MFVAALFRITRTWKQPRCPSTDEWIKEMWNMYNMEYYSAIKRIEFESVLMRWMNLASIIQSEVSGKEKNKYHMLLSLKVIFNSLQPHGLQNARLLCPSLSSAVCSNSCSLSWWCHPTLSSFVVPSPPALNLSQHQGLCQWVHSLHQVARVLELKFQH